jgi:hypothetical protein
MSTRDPASAARLPHMGFGQMASTTLRTIALIAFALLLILVLLPAALVAAGT